MHNYPFPPKDYGELNEQDFTKNSATDCTGLIPTAPLNDAEFESYEEVYSFLPPPPDKSDRIIP